MKKTVSAVAVFFLACLPVFAGTTLRIHAGGSAYRDSKGQTWSADQGFNSGSLSHSAPLVTVTGTTDPSLFKSARVAPASGTELQYQFPVANGSYKVNLYFAETYYSSKGQRVFDVQMQGANVISALDIFGQVGARHALVKSVPVSVINGQLVIRFVRRTNGNVPIISGLEILPAVASTPLAPSIATQPAAQSITVGNTATFHVVAAGTAPFTYQWEKSGVVISGATGATYSTPAVTTTDNGKTFRVVVKNSLGSVTSNSATLSVTTTSGGGTSGGGPTVAISWSDVHQEIDGFGASDAWTGLGITNAQADLFWSTTNGVGLSLLRVQVQPNGTYPDVATMQKAQTRGVRIWAAPWTPPAAMKTNSSLSNGGNLLASEYGAYANYLAGYVSTLKNSYGINLYALSIQNEPNWTASWDSCIWSGQNFHDFITHLHPALVAKGLNTKVIFAESAQWSFDLTTATLNDPSTAAAVSILAAHNYDGGGAKAFPLGQNMGKHLWETEVSTFESFDPSISNGLKWAQKISDWMTIADANAWHYWWLISGSSDNEGLLGSGGQVTKRLYVMGNFSKFVRPGYYRIGATASPVSGVSISAYKDPATGKFAIVAINHNSSAVGLDFSFNGFSASSVDPWVTSSTLNLVKQASIPAGSQFKATLAAQSVTTFVGQ